MSKTSEHWCYQKQNLDGRPEVLTEPSFTAGGWKYSTIPLKILAWSRSKRLYNCYANLSCKIVSKGHKPWHLTRMHGFNLLSGSTRCFCCCGKSIEMKDYRCFYINSLTSLKRSSIHSVACDIFQHFYMCFFVSLNVSNKCMAKCSYWYFGIIRWVCERTKTIAKYGSSYRMNDIFHQIPDECKYNHIYHRACYSKYTIYLNSLEEVRDEEQPSSNQVREPRRSSVDKGS